jgi:hypothetical protein
VDVEDDNSASSERGGTRPHAIFANSVDELFEFSLPDLDPSHMVGTSIQNVKYQ